MQASTNNPEIIQIRREKVLTVAEAAKFLEVSRGTVYNLVRSGRLDSYKDSKTGRVYLLREDVEKAKNPVLGLVLGKRS